MNVINAQDSYHPLDPCVAILCVRSTKTPFNRGHPQHSWSVTEYVTTVASMHVCAYVFLRICRWQAVHLHLQEAQAFGLLEPRMLPSVVLSARWIPKTPLCPLQTLIALPGVFYHIKWYQKLLGCSLWLQNEKGPQGTGMTSMQGKTRQMGAES